MSPSLWQADLAAARYGDRAALGRLLDDLRGYLHQIAGDKIPVVFHAKVDATDLVQQTFLEATKGFERFGGSTPDQWRAWLRGILRHLVGHIRRDFNRLRRSVHREMSLHGAGVGSVLVIDLRGREAPPDEQLAEHETRQAFDAAITQLPKRYRQIIDLRSLENRPYDEIGPLLGISADAAQKLWTRAIDHLARELE